MIFGDCAIRSAIAQGYISGVDESMINPASLNIRLGNSFLAPLVGQKIVLGQKVEYREFNLKQGDRFVIKPGHFILGTTLECLNLPERISAFVQGRSSIGRIGLTIQNAGFVDPGFHGHITLELINDAPFPIYLLPGYPVGQLVFLETSEVEHPYSGKYNGQVAATGSRMEQDRQKYSHLLI